MSTADRNTPLQILIIGAGAIGCLVGAKLATSGQAVTLVGRPRFAELVRTQGIRLQDERGTHAVRTIRATGSVAEAFAEGHTPYDLAILTVKSYDTETAIAELQTAHATLPAIVSLQNGVGNEERLAAALGPARVIAGTITTPVSVPTPGTIHIERPTLGIGLSPWTPHEQTQMLTALTAVLRQAGFTVRRYPNAPAMKWTKLLMNMMANATSAILDEPPVQLFANPALVDLEIAAWREALAAMRQAGLRPENLGDYPLRFLAPLIRTLPTVWLRPILRRHVIDARGDKLPSLHLDLDSGKGRSEVGWLNGAVVALGKQVGVATPINDFLTETLLALIHDPQRRDEWRHHPERLINTAQANAERRP
jgi:2-dehydropantoate 2-reductase